MRILWDSALKEIKQNMNYFWFEKSWRKTTHTLTSCAKIENLNFLSFKSNWVQWELLASLSILKITNVAYSALMLCAGWLTVHLLHLFFIAVKAHVSLHLIQYGICIQLSAIMQMCLFPFSHTHPVRECETWNYLFLPHSYSCISPPAFFFFHLFVFLCSLKKVKSP